MKASDTSMLDSGRLILSTSHYQASLLAIQIVRNKAWESLSLHWLSDRIIITSTGFYTILGVD